MDAIDRKILAVLQTNGRLTVTELAHQVKLSLSPCHRRLRALETAGVISGYRATLDPARVGLGFQALVFVTMGAADRHMISQFEEAVSAQPNVVDAQRLFGDPDYLLRVVTADLEAFRGLYDSALSTLPGVLRLSSTLVMKPIIENRPLPIRAPAHR